MFSTSSPTYPASVSVALANLHVGSPGVGHPSVMVMHSHGKDPLRFVLSHDVLVEEGLDLAGGRNGEELPFAFPCPVQLLVDHMAAQLNTLIADIDGRTFDQLGHLVLPLLAERTTRTFSGGAPGRHHLNSFRRLSFSFSLEVAPFPSSFLETITSSMMPYALASSAPR